jgi:plasmid stabilization system protein ParE
MGRRVVWSAAANADLDAIDAYISARSPSNAQRVLRKLRQTAGALGDYPFAARVVPEFGDPSRRETFVFEYRLIYRVEDDRVRILRVVHGRRLLRNVPGSFEEHAQAGYRAA